MCKISVIILNWNGERLLKEFLPQVLNASNSDISEVIVADNGSRDGSLDYCRWLGVRTMEFDQNYGFAGGYNRALELVDTPFTVLLNSDVAPRAGWDEAMLAYMESHDNCGAVQPKILSWNDPEYFEYAGACGGFLDRHGYPYCRGRIFGVVERDNGQYDTEMEVDWASGAALMVRTDAYKRVGGLDESFFAHMEEIDLCWRMRLAGYSVAVCPKAEVLHLGGGSLPMGNPHKTYLNFRNNLLLLHKNLPPTERGRALTVRRLLDTLAFCKSVATFHFADARAILKAHRDYRLMAPDTRTSGAGENLLRHRPNILTHYYLLGHKKFDKL